MTLKPFVTFLSKLKGFKLDASDLLTNMYSNNAGMILDVETDQIRQMFDLVAEHGWQPQFLLFLTHLCSVNGKIIYDKQYHIAQTLLPDNIWCIPIPFLKSGEDEDEDEDEDQDQDADEGGDGGHNEQRGGSGNGHYER